MRRAARPMLVAVLAVLLIAASPAAQKSDSAQALLRAAMDKAVVDGDLNAAINQYQAIVARFKTDRAVVATALVRMAECYQKLGDAQARTIYERVVREYSDQKEAVTIARVRLSSDARLSSASITTRQVWTGPKASVSGAVSSDGRYLSGTDWGTGDLLLHDVSDGTDRRLTNKGSWLDSGEYAEGSVFAPDGKQVAYGWYNANRKASGYDLRLISVSASSPATPRILYDNADVEWIAPYDWSPDGKWIGVQMHRRDRTVQIALVAAADGSLHVLKSVDWRESSAMFFSPDSQYVAFDLPSSQDSARRDVFVLAINGSREIPAVVHPASDVVMGWTPDGTHLLFSSDRTGSMGVWALPFRQGKPQGAPRLVKPDIGRARAMGLTRSGKLYFGLRTDGPDLYIASVDFDSGTLVKPPARATEEFIGSNGNPDWSHDGKYLAYTSHRALVVGTNVVSSSFPNVLAIRSMETGDVRELQAKLRGRIQSLRWAPDGGSLAVESTDRQGQQGIYRVHAQTAEVSLIGEGQLPQWAPDGSKLFYRRGEGVIVERELAAGKEREVMRRANPCRPSLSPDGHYLACVDFGDGATKGRTLWVFPVEGGEPRALLRLTEPHTFGNLVAWMPDSRSVLLWVPGNEPHHWLVPVAGGEPRKIDLGVDFGQAFNVRIHPNGREVVFTAGSDKSEVWVLENFLPALSARRLNGRR